jgi:cholesterol transport system auxiliary component
MHHLRNLSVFLALLPVLSGACVNLKQPTHKVDHYTLEYDPREIGDLAPAAAVIRVEPFTTAPDYNARGIVYRDEEFKRESYVYHKWRSSPGDLVTHFLVRDMRQSGAFQAVLFQETTVACTHVLEGCVDEFFEWSRGPDSRGVLGVSVTLIAENEPNIPDRILSQRSYRVSMPCQPNHPESLAKALSLGLADISAQMVSDIHRRLTVGTE